MKWFNNLKIRVKLFIAFGTLILLMFFLVVYTASQLVYINRTYSSLTESTINMQTDLANALEALALLRLNNISTAYTINNDIISSSLYHLRSQDNEDMCNSFTACLDNYRKNLAKDTSQKTELRQEGLNMVNDAEKWFEESFRHCHNLIQEGVAEKDKNKVGSALSEAGVSATNMTVILNHLREQAAKYAQTETKKISESSQRIVFTQFIVAAVIMLVSVLLSAFMSRRIELPIYRLAQASAKIAGGDLSWSIRDDSRDELGILSNSIGDMVDSMKKANQSKSNFLANMSHEMRTPLNVVVGLTDLHMDDARLPPDILTDIKKINSAGDLLLGIVNDVLDISKIEAGRLELQLTEYDTASILNDIITLNMIRIESKPVKFNVDISENLPCGLYGDDLRIKQILNNLLSNAFKYTRKGTVTLRIYCTKEEGDTIWISITVSDTGIGIRQEDLRKLFSDYNQVDTKANRSIEGTGLGLSITKKLVNLMEGEITVESEYGKGASFHVTLKQKKTGSKRIGPDTAKNLRNFQYIDTMQHASATIFHPDLSYARVLVVDDYQTNLDVAAGLLRKYKIHVDCVLSGTEAVSLIKRETPFYSAIFMDHMMPGMDGIEATRIIRNMDSDYARTIPVISLTANALAGNEEMFLSNGFSAFLSKPINSLKLDSVVKKFIRKKNPDTDVSTASADVPQSGKK